VTSLGSIHKALFSPVTSLVLALIFVTPVFSGKLLAERDQMDAAFMLVRYEKDDTIRGFVGKHLRDPDLWPLVLDINDIASPADLSPGMDLRLPVRQVLAADGALLTSLNAIQTANSEGARIFAPDEIGKAIENRDLAVKRRVEGEWRQVASYADISVAFANQALDISISLRDQAAEAVVSDVQGDVEGRTPAEPGWSDRDLNDVLVEFERLRTLSASTTQVTFRDQSRLRLNANSNATIQRMRSDPLTGGEVTKVSLIDGDFYALLNQLSENTSFEIDVAGIETSTNSADFWVKSDQSGARFVNYDSPQLEITQGNQTISLGENQGVVVSGNTAERTEILTSPRLAAPQRGAVIYAAEASLQWDEFNGAEAYWLEVSSDPGFNQMQVSEWGVREAGYQAAGLPPARYHWRVAALDKLGLPGEWSSPQDFTLRTDDTPPYLTLLSPGPDTIATQPRIDLLGATEVDATLILNGAALAVGEDGSFLGELDLIEGRNNVTVEASDPAGNQSTRSLTVIYRPAATVEINLSDQIPRVGPALATQSDRLTVQGQTTANPGAVVVVREAAGTELLRTLVTGSRTMQFVVPAGVEPREYSVEILAPGGAIEGRLYFLALLDRVPPALTLDLPPPRVTGDQMIQISGSAEDAIKVEVNGTPVSMDKGRFDLELPLEPGENQFELLASDATGNVGLTHFEVLMDIDPPEILRTELGRPQGDGGPIELEVEARDPSGLRQATPFVITVGGNERVGYLRCETASGLCRASLPPEPGALELIELLIEDYAGNTAFQ
jgi:glucodextranase-like protein/FecR-like protein